MPVCRDPTWDSPFQLDIGIETILDVNRPASWFDMVTGEKMCLRRMFVVQSQRGTQTEAWTMDLALSLTLDSMEYGVRRCERCTARR